MKMPQTIEELLHRFTLPETVGDSAGMAGLVKTHIDLNILKIQVNFEFLHMS